MPNPDTYPKHPAVGSYSSGSPSSGTPTNIPPINPVTIRTNEESVHGLRLNDREEEEEIHDDTFYRLVFSCFGC